jgi:hypothetical protein
VIIETGPLIINYCASPTLAKFHASDALVRGVMGPIGSGKSVGMCNEIFARAQQQRQGPDGIRRVRVGIIRNTYGELKQTTIRTWLDWYGELTTMRYDMPITGLLRFQDVEIELLFVSCDKPKDIKKLLSLDLTFAWINEAREVPKSILDALIGRIGRYPAVRDGGCTWRGVLMDTNPPDDIHWWYKLAEEERPIGFAFWRQPPALLKGLDGSYVPNPKAENIDNLDGGFEYYLRQVPGKRDEWIKVYILGEYGTVLEGRVVFPEYSDAMHCAEDILEAMRGIPLILGWDYGRTPACIFGQLTPRGQLRIIDELVVDASGEGMGIRTFTKEVVKPHLANNYAGMEVSLSWGDPAGDAKGQGEEYSCMDIQGQEGIPTVPANSNDPAVRQDAVVKFLKTNIDGEPGYLLSPKCTYLRRGFLGGYRYAKLNVSGDERYKDAPEKNRYSHPHDANQALCQAALSGGVEIRPVARAQKVQQRSAGGWT